MFVKNSKIIFIDIVQLNPSKTSVIVRSLEHTKEQFFFNHIFEGPLDSRLDNLDVKT